MNTCSYVQFVADVKPVVTSQNRGAIAGVTGWDVERDDAHA